MVNPFRLLLGTHFLFPAIKLHGSYKTTSNAIHRVDFHTAAAFHTPPTFPQINLDPDTPSLPDGLLEQAAYTSPTCLLQLSLAAVDCFNIFYRLHRLALAVSTPWFQQVDRLTISNMLYETEHMILSVPDYSQDFIHFDLGAKDEQQDEDEEVKDYGERAQMADSASVIEALLAAVHIFVYASLRELPLRAKIFNIFLERLRVAIERPAVCTLDVWRREKNLGLLLWVLVVATSMTPTWGDRAWWIARLGEVVQELRIYSELELEALLQRVAWTDIFFGDRLGDIWRDVRDYIKVAELTELLAKDQEHEGDLLDSRIVEQGEELEEELYCPVEFERGRWKINGWYV